MEKKYLLNTKWQFKLSNKNSLAKDGGITVKPGRWFNGSVPGTIHTDLLNLKLIDQPFYSDNEKRLQWIGECDWTYKTSFDYPKEFDKSEKTFLVFDGLDTASEIYLNGEKIGSACNMFLRLKFDLSGLIKPKNNSLEINFISPVKYARALEAEKGRLPVALNSERVYIRKAQYSFGWDWGPSFVTMGIWKDAYLLQQDEYAVESLTFNTLRIEDRAAIVGLKIKLNKPAEDEVSYKISLRHKEEKTVLNENAVKNELETGIEFSVPEPALWWPNGLGEQNLYDLEIQVMHNERTIDEIKRRVGIRTVELLLKDGGKNTFRFEVNGKPVFLKGVNWIPADSFLPRVDESKYRELLSLAKEGNMNVVRVWGGGIYENDVFYNLCDELGLLVWQDFMFACASYPEYDEFLNSVREEVEQNVVRLQYHPSIAIWCGNNENEWIFYQEQKRSFKEMSGYKIYHEIIPGILKRLDPVRPYWPSTPFSFEEDPNSPLSGNRHQWAIWSWWVDYKEVRKDESLFVTEFGFQSAANYSTITKALPQGHHSSQSRIFEYHNKQVEGPERLFKFLSAHLPVRTKLKDFIYLTQLNQGLALKECVEHWQSRFPESNGSIIWQLNDCWPVSSWALVDSDLIPKLSYYMVKESFSKILITAVKDESGYKIIIVNNSPYSFAGTLMLNSVSLPSGKIASPVKKKVIIDQSAKKEIYPLPVSAGMENGEYVCVMSIFDNENNLVNRSFLAGTEFKYIKMPRANIKIKQVKNQNSVKVSTDKPAFFVHLESAGLKFERNGLIILPDEKITVKYSGKAKNIKKEPEITCTTLNQYLE